MVQRGHARPGPHIEVLRHRRHGSAGDGGVRVRATKGMEMPLGRPDGVEAIGIREFGPFEQQFVFLGTDTVVIAPVEQVEVDPAVARGNQPVRHERPAIIARQHQFEAPREGPEQL